MYQIPEWQLAAFQNSTAAKRSPKAALLALKLRLAGKPVVLLMATLFTHNSFIYSVIPKMVPTRLLIQLLNDCFFCQNAHGGIAQHYLQCDMPFIDQVKKNYQSTSISNKLKALLSIAASVQRGGKNVTTEQVEKARGLGATDQEIHDTVLIAAAFCMFNRYVDGLGTWAPEDHELYVQRGPRRAEEGYINFDLCK